MAYIGTEPKDIRSFGRAKFDYTASQGQTAFTGADDDGKVLAFTTGQINVYVNGILMDDSDFTTTGTGTVTLASAANLNDVISIVSFESNIPDNDYVPASGGTFTGNVTNSGTTTMTGDLTVGSSDFFVDVSDDVVGVGTTSPATPINKFGGSAKGLAVKAGQPTVAVEASANSQYVGYLGQAGTNTYLGAVGGGSLIVQTGTSGTTRMTIDNSGRVTMPNQPAFAIQGGYNGWTTLSQAGGFYPFTGSSGVATSTNTEWAMAWVSNNEGGYNPTGNGINTTNGLYTAPVAGTYLFTFQAYLQKLVSGSQYIHVNSYINGSNQEDYTLYGAYQDSSTYAQPEIAKVIRMSANDTFQFRMYLGTANAFRMYPRYTLFTGVLLG